MNFEFMTIDTPLPPCMPFPRALTGFPVSSTAKVMYCRMLDAMLSKGQEDENGILFVCFPVTAIAAVLSRSPMTVKRSLNELETAGLIMRVRQGIGEPNRIYVLIPGKEDAPPPYPSTRKKHNRNLVREKKTEKRHKTKKGGSPVPAALPATKGAPAAAPAGG